ncbi:hypothetical protein SALBM135S_00986 [Streptomyces alboniger]
MTVGNSPLLPLVVEGHGEPAVQRLRAGREDLRAALRERGALLLRGFDVGGADGFADIVRALSGEPLPYTERSSPRSVIKGNVYTSTDYPPGEEIFLHNENSYQASWPLTLYFHCVRPPLTRGATPLADTRRVLAAVDDEVRREFARRGWTVVRNYGDLVGLPWQRRSPPWTARRSSGTAGSGASRRRGCPAAGCAPGRSGRPCTGTR